MMIGGPMRRHWLLDPRLVTTLLLTSSNPTIPISEPSVIWLSDQYLTNVWKIFGWLSFIWAQPRAAFSLRLKPVIRAPDLMMVTTTVKRESHRGLPIFVQTATNGLKLPKKWLHTTRLSHQTETVKLDHCDWRAFRRRRSIVCIWKIAWKHVSIRKTGLAWGGTRIVAWWTSDHPGALLLWPALPLKGRADGGNDHLWAPFDQVRSVNPTLLKFSCGDSRFFEPVQLPGSRLIDTKYAEEPECDVSVSKLLSFETFPFFHCIGIGKKIGIEKVSDSVYKNICYIYWKKLSIKSWICLFETC